jgi:hypothetical protein
MREGEGIPAHHGYGRRGRQGQTREWKSDFGKSPKKRRRNPILFLGQRDLMSYQERGIQIPKDPHFGPMSVI